MGIAAFWTHRAALGAAVLGIGLAALGAAAPARAQSGTDVRWVECAREGGVCRTGGRGDVSVRFGADGRYAWRTVRRDTRCDVATFGDPAPGQHKRCEMQVAVVDRPEPLPGGAVGGGWRACADEGEVCRIGYGREATVRFGADGRYEWRTVRGEVACDTATFGDPAPGVRKRCDVQAGRPVAVAPSPGGGYGWRRCAGEGETCSVASGATVRFGADGRYRTIVAQGGGWGGGVDIACDTARFGDPAPGVHKQCEVRDGAGVGAGAGGQAAAGWTFCAREGQTCRTPPGATRVRYGAGERHVERRVVGSIACTNAAFGTDPAPGTGKSCEVRGGGGGGGGGAAADWGSGETGWARCAQENDYCNDVRGAVEARFGASGRFTYRQFTERFACNAIDFGVDPAPGERKYCEIAAPNARLR